MSIPDKAVEAAARKRAQHYESEYDSTHLVWQDFAAEAREILEAAEPYLTGGVEREKVSDLRAWVNMQREAAGIDDTEYAAGEFLAYKRVLTHLNKILAAHSEVES